MTPEPVWVDLGLPSGLLWAKANLGATLPESLGIYFSWGNIEGHPVGSGYDFSQEVYDTTPAAAISADLSLDQDAARANLGSPWRMPTAAEFQELYDNCDSVWTSLNGMNGRLFTSRVNGNTLFIPAAGFWIDNELRQRDSIGHYRSSTYVNTDTAKILNFNNSSVSPQSNDFRYCGFTIRAVRSA